MEPPPAKRRRVDPAPSHELPLPPPRARAAFPRFAQPSQVGVFSLDAARRWRDSDTARRRLAPLPPPPVALDLREGYARFVARDEGRREGLDHLLRWLRAHPPPAPPDMVTWRGHLTKVLCTPFDRGTPWRLAAVRHGPTVYLRYRFSFFL